MYNFINRMSLACGMIPNEEYHTLPYQRIRQAYSTSLAM